MAKLVELIKQFGLRALVALTIIVVSACVALFGYDVATVQHNKVLLGTLAQDAVSRAELSADYAVITLSDVASSGLYDCDASSLAKIRKAIYLRGTVKDVRIYGSGGQLRCAGLPQMSDYGTVHYSTTAGIPAGNNSILFQDAGSDGAGLLGVEWRFNRDLTLYSVVNLDAMMFSIFPAALRDSSEADLLLGDEVIAQHVPMGGKTLDDVEFVTIMARSSRYPLGIKIRVDKLAAANWNRDLDVVAMVIGTVVGIVLAILSTILMSRPRDPRRDIADALRNDEFKPYMQPIFALDGKRILGCEVLARWVKPNGTVIPPYAFIPLAEETGMIIPMTRALITSALAELGPLLKRDKNFKVAFNIVPEDMVSENFVDDICALVKDAGVARRQIVIEITERQPFEDPSAGIAAIGVLQNLGFRVALDDTGTGHNGLSQVQDLGADILKIDKHFVDLVGKDLAATKIIEMLVHLAVNLGMTSVAEGIETQEQLDALLACGVDEGQGYLVSRPLVGSEFLALVAASAETGQNEKVAA